MNILLSYCGLVDAKIRASEIDLPKLNLINYLKNFFDSNICSILGVIAGADGRSLLSATKKESASDHTNLKDYDRDLETKWQQEVTVFVLKKFMCGIMYFALA